VAVVGSNSASIACAFDTLASICESETSAGCSRLTSWANSVSATSDVLHPTTWFQRASCEASSDAAAGWSGGASSAAGN